ncbi:methyl-accepting chemotaxis protein, partial [Caulobacter sp. HMWF009]
MRFTLKLQLSLAFGLVIALLLASTLFGLNSLSTTNRELNDLVDGPAVRLNAAQKLNVHMLDLVRLEKTMILVGSPEEVQALEGEVAREKSQFEALLAKAEGLAPAEDKPRWKALGSSWEELSEVHGQVYALAQAGRDRPATALSMGEGRKHAEDVSAKVQALVELSQAELEAATRKADADFVAIRNGLIGLAVVSLLIAVGAAVFIATTVSRGLRRASDAVRAVAEGDLTRKITITTRDEIADLLGHVNLMVERLRGVVGDALSASDNVSSGSQQLSATSEQV